MTESKGGKERQRRERGTEKKERRSREEEEVAQQTELLTLVDDPSYIVSTSCKRL